MSHDRWPFQQHSILWDSKPHPTNSPSVCTRDLSVSPHRIPTNSPTTQHILLLHKIRQKKLETVSPDSVFFRGSYHGCKICEMEFNKIFFMRNVNRHCNLCWFLWTDAVILVGATSETLCFCETCNLISLAPKTQINHSDWQHTDGQLMNGCRAHFLTLRWETNLHQSQETHPMLERVPELQGTPSLDPISHVIPRSPPEQKGRLLWLTHKTLESCCAWPKAEGLSSRSS